MNLVPDCTSFQRLKTAIFIATHIKRYYKLAISIHPYLFLRVSFGLTTSGVGGDGGWDGASGGGGGGGVVNLVNKTDRSE